MNFGIPTGEYLEESSQQFASSNNDIVYMMGLTGGIGSGKSSAGSYLSSLGAVVIDADQVLRDLYARKDNLTVQLFKDLKDEFGAEIFANDGTVDRRILGSQVFGTTVEHEVRRQALNGITHPAIDQEVKAKINYVKKKFQGSAPLVIVYENPLLIEAIQGGTKNIEDFDIIINISLPLRDRIQRLMDSRNLTKDEAISRINSQTNDDERSRISDITLDNSGSPQDLYARLDKVMENLPRRSSS